MSPNSFSSSVFSSFVKINDNTNDPIKLTAATIPATMIFLFPSGAINCTIAVKHGVAYAYAFNLNNPMINPPTPAEIHAAIIGFFNFNVIPYIAGSVTPASNAEIPAGIAI